MADVRARATPSVVACAACLAVLVASSTFAAPLAARAPAARPSLSSGTQGQHFPALAAASSLAIAVSGLAVVLRRRSTAGSCGKTASAPPPEAKTSLRYTTQMILPAFAWIDTGLEITDLAPTQLIAKNVAGNDVLIGKDEQGTLFCVSNLCPHIDTPMSEGAEVIGDVIVCPLHRSSFSTKTGDLIDWCPSPPIIGPLTGLAVDKRNLKIFDIRNPPFGGNLEVQVDTNAKRAYEADYWKGLLDAQGKDDGTYY